MEINAAMVVQGVMVAVLVGVGSAVWNASISIAKMGASFDAHTKMDTDRFATVEKRFDNVDRQLERAADIASNR
jgi:hypothetical protein